MLYLARSGTSADWLAICKEILKITFQALAIGALGGLVKLIIDRRKAEEAKDAELRRQEEGMEREQQQRHELAVADAHKAAEVAETELRDRRYRFISTLVELTRSVDEARLVVRANRSVKSWTDMINDRIIPARARLRDITHEHWNWADAGSPVFEDTDSINDALFAMDAYLRTLLTEYADSKQELSEVQLWAEQAKGKSHEERQERKRLLNQIWNEMQELPILGDLMDDGPRYGAYRKAYVDTLLKMRRSLTPQSTTTPLLSDPP